MSGWIKLHRQLIDWEWYSDPNVVRLFIHCLLKANHSQKTWRGIKIEKGQFVTSMNKLSNELELSVQKVRTAIDKLIITKEIQSKSTNKFTIITICKYDDYQCAGAEKNIPQTDKYNSNNMLLTTTKNNKNNNNEISFEEKIRLKKERENQFRDEVIKEYRGKFDKKTIEEFCDYWTESNPNGFKLKFEMEKVFDVSRRLKNWSSKDYNRKFFKGGKNHQTDFPECSNFDEYGK
jgi:hypothetical protein